MSPFFSIIIPCCDVEPWLRTCLDSVTGQSFRDWECLAVIEDSRDGTARLLRELTAGDPRFRIFSRPRSGSPSAPRNTALDHAGGEYAIFLDGDDALAEGALQRLADRIGARPGADLYPCALREIDTVSGDSRICDNYPPEAPSELTGSEAIRYLGRFWLMPNPMAQLTICRRAFLDEHSLRFVPGLKHEDNEFTPRALYLARRVVPLHEVFYVYRFRRADSITSRERGGECALAHFARVYHSLLSFYAAVSAAPDFDRRVAKCWAREWSSRIFILWFSSRFVARIPRRRRRAALRRLFSGGAARHFRSLLRDSSPARRIAGWWVAAFLRARVPGWAAEQFFLRIYFPLTERRRGK